MSLSFDGDSPGRVAREEGLLRAAQNCAAIAADQCALFIEANRPVAERATLLTPPKQAQATAGKAYLTVDSNPGQAHVVLDEAAAILLQQRIGQTFAPSSPRTRPRASSTSNGSDTPPAD